MSAVNYGYIRKKQFYLENQLCEALTVKKIGFPHLMVAGLS